MIINLEILINITKMNYKSNSQDLNANDFANNKYLKYYIEL